jgi:hypothetical protein
MACSRAPDEPVYPSNVMSAVGSLALAVKRLARHSPPHASTDDDGNGRMGEHVDYAQIGLLLVGWVVAFLLGKELQAGFVQWREGHRGE